MKKIIMFVMVFAIAIPSLADDLNPPEWAGAPGTIYGIYNFPVELPDGEGTFESFPYGDYPEEGLMVPHDTNPDPCEYDETIDTEGAHQHMMITYVEFVPEWTATHEGREGVLLSPTGFTLSSYNFPGSGTMLIQLQITYFGEGTISEFWSEAAFAVISPPEEQIDLGDGWFHSTWEMEIEGHPDNEGIYFQTSGDFEIDQIVMDVISYQGDIPPYGPGRPGAKQPPLTVDSTSNLPVYEPQDAGGPPPAGSTQGQLFVNLAWRPGEDLTYPAFTATVVVEPNEVGLHEDFIFSDSTDPNGTITLTFTEADWNIPQPVNVEAVEDLDREGNQYYPIELTVTINIADPNFGNPTPVVVTNAVSVVDNDIPYISVLPPGVLENVLTENDPCVPVCVNVTLSHEPESDVYVLVAREIPEYGSSEVLLESMSVMNPPLGATDDPNKLKFTPGNYNVNQTICLEARDDDVLAEAFLEWVGGNIFFTPYSEDLRYLVSWLNPDGSGAPIIPDDPCDPCGPGEPYSGGEAKETTVGFNVQDNECGSVGYPPYDKNENCYVDLSELAALYRQWFFCTDPYDHEDYGVWGDCDASWNLVETEEE